VCCEVSAFVCKFVRVCVRVVVMEIEWSLSLLLLVSLGVKDWLPWLCWISATNGWELCSSGNLACLGRNTYCMRLCVYAPLVWWRRHSGTWEVTCESTRVSAHIHACSDTHILYFIPRQAIHSNPIQTHLVYTFTDILYIHCVPTKHFVPTKLQ
jgi:hypothetical protein